MSDAWTIRKYPLHIVDLDVIRMPENGRILCIGMQQGEPCIWVAVDPEAPLVEREFLVVGTGHPVRDVGIGDYIGTFYVGSLDFHVFECD